MKRSKFNLSHTQLHTSEMGRLIPIGCIEVLPGDTIQHASQVLIRMAPLATPPLHPVRIDVRHFFVPNRLVWDEWEDFITGGPDGMNDATPPYINTGNHLGSNADHLGIPPTVTPPTAWSAMPLRGVALIWNEFYRDQDLQEPLIISKAGGYDTETQTIDLWVNWEKDYFTTARPFEQKGPDITLPLGVSAPLSGTAMITSGGAASTPGTTFPIVRGEADTGGQASVDLLTGTLGIGTPLGLQGTIDGIVDLSTATAATVNQLRLALALQRNQEARARYGSRYTEYLAYLGVRSADSRLQRPEYLGGSRSSVQFSEVLSTSTATAADGETSTIPGNFGGHGIGANRSNRYRKFFSEHGFVISLLSVIPQTMYPNALARMWQRQTRWDFWQKELEHIGQQQVLNREVNASHTNPDGLFGYQDRFDEYRRTESGVHSRFRPGQYLSDWHFARNVPNNVALNEDFVRCVPVTSPFQVQTVEGENAETLYIAARHQVVARRLVAPRGNSYIL